MSSRLKLFQVDAFAREVFRGNPAAVVPLDRWLNDETLAAIARENNLSETAFLLPRGEDFEIRWFTPEVEVDLCGHATLASGWVVLNRLQPERQRVTFHSKSGPLVVAREDGTDALAMWLPSRPPSPVLARPELAEALGARPREILAARDYLVVFENEAQIRALSPDMAKLKTLDRFGVCVTAPGSNGVDFVSRFFAPGEGIPEDPVTGSAHSTLVPYWSKRLGKERLVARQLSARGGELDCVNEGERVRLVGRAVLFFEGEIAAELRA